MLAKTTLIGNLGREPEVKQTTSGDRYARFSVAINKTVKGEKSTMWVDVSCWDSKKVEVLEAYARKGTKLFVEGDLTTRTYTDKNGHEKLAVEVVIGRFDGKLLLLSSRDDGAATPQQSVGGASRNPAANWDLDDDVPFD